ncbi:3'-5' exonuclease [Miltoncostaea marina]|uniref:3'-5' exonuclease n=1 Tax=Miltoncostaea marina TaxID=2843215 RepID=UPI001C3E1B23|nr:3'-5' exonuclease [Miltoncostaea marina]
MRFLIADTFTDSLAKLAAEEQKAVKMTAFDLQTNPAHPGLKFHRLDRAKDKDFWSVRAGRDIRIIVHRRSGDVVLCYADHHDPAYAWAERRRMTTHPTTGAAQLIEVRETVQEVIVPVHVPQEAPAPAAPALFADRSDDELLGYGVPEERVADVRAATEESLLVLADDLPAEAAEALLELATGGTPPVRLLIPGGDPFEHPDAQRRFRVMHDIEELQRALDYPWDRWMVFLHPAQREIVEGRFSGPARVSGAAGTGKTIVALHRAVFLAGDDPDSRVLLTTYSDTLGEALRARLGLLVGNRPRVAERLEVRSITEVGRTLYRARFGEPRIASRAAVAEILREAASSVEAHPFSERFLAAEWEHVVDAWQLTTWEAYRDVRRLGRRTRLAESQRAVLWQIFELVRAGLAQKGLLTESEVQARLAEAIVADGSSPYSHVVVDEAQDMGVAHLRLLAALGGNRADGLFFAGDLGQRIFAQPFSWKSLGVDIRGRSRTLRVNYRTSHQIRTNADRLLDPEQSDADGNVESRAGTISVFNGPAPEVKVLDDAAAEISAVAEWLRTRLEEGFTEGELGVFVRSGDEIERAERALASAGVEGVLLDDGNRMANGRVAVSTMHLAKGLEFRGVAVMACDDEVIPSQARIDAIADVADLEDVYSTERHLLYVACTRARDNLLVTGVRPASEFLDDLT